MASDAVKPPDVLEQSMQEALAGSFEAGRRFFLAFLQGPIYVPERRQIHPLTEAPSYPNDFVNILGIQDKERAVVPAFSRLEHVEQWFGGNLECKTLSGLELIKLVPADWWICFNPGREVEKEISPWEIDQLRGGEEGIGAVLAEIFLTGPAQTLSVRTLRDNEHAAVRAALKSLADARPEISSIYLLIEEGRDADENPIETLLIGLEIDSSNLRVVEDIRCAALSLAQKAEIGGNPVKVYAGGAGGKIALKALEGSPPFLCRRSASPIRRWSKALSACFSKKS